MSERRYRQKTSIRRHFSNMAARAAKITNLVMLFRISTLPPGKVEIRKEHIKIYNFSKLTENFLLCNPLFKPNDRTIRLRLFKVFYKIQCGRGKAWAKSRIIASEHKKERMQAKKCNNNEQAGVYWIIHIRRFSLQGQYTKHSLIV